MAIRSFNDFEYTPGTIEIGGIVNDANVFRVEDGALYGGYGLGFSGGGGTGTTVIPGCTDPSARNYNSFATRNDGSC